MREYISVNGVLIPKPASWSLAPVLLPAWDTAPASIPSQPDRSGDEFAFIPECLNRWADRRWAKAAKNDPWQREPSQIRGTF